MKGSGYFTHVLADQQVKLFQSKRTLEQIEESQDYLS